jgi:cell division septal protein FtsQ
MAVENRYPLTRPLFSGFPAGEQAFHRSGKKSGAKVRTSKKVLSPGHLILAFGLLAAFFAGLAGLYYYAISCDRLEIKKVEVVSTSPQVKQAIENYLSRQKLGNILVCDLNYLRTVLNRLPGVKDVRLEKILPSALKVEALPRIPRLYVHRGSYQLIDEEGEIIASYSELPDQSWPFLEDSNAWRRNYKEKVALVCQAIGRLEPALRDRIKMIKLLDQESLEIQLAGDPVKIMTSDSNLAENLSYYLSTINFWAEQLGPLEYMDLRLADRIYVKPLNLQAEKTPAREKEVS